MGRRNVSRPPRGDSMHSELAPLADRDFVLLLQDWRIEVGAERPNPFHDQFNLFTITVRVEPDTEHLNRAFWPARALPLGNLSA